MHLYFTGPLRELGHEVSTFDHFETAERFGREQATEELVRRIKDEGFDVVFYQTSGREPVDTEAFAEVSQRTCVAAWNSDDDWQWETTREIAGHFTFMVTTYPHIHERNRSEYPNLLLSQWGCPGMLGAERKTKDIDFSFAGSIYGERNRACRYLRRKAGLVCVGRGARLVRLGLPYFRGAFKMNWLAGAAVELEEVYDLWSRTRISYTPLEAGARGAGLQIKGRIFEMGLCGTMVLCEQTPALERYYEPGEEIVTFEGLEDCAEKALWYSRHEADRTRIVQNYQERTRREHLWTQRFEELFKTMGLSRSETIVQSAGAVG
jgi:hypothetical protein